MAHDVWLHGVVRPPSARFESIGTLGGFDLLLVRPTADGLVRKVADDVMTLIYREHQLGVGAPKVYRKIPLRKWQPRTLLPHLVLLASATRLLGAIVLEWRPLAGVRNWRDPVDLFVPASPEAHDWCLSYAWLHRTVRRQHIGPAAAALVAAGLNRESADFLFLPPFTRKGESVSRAVSPGVCRLAKSEFPTNYSNLVYPFAAQQEIGA